MEGLLDHRGVGVRRLQTVKRVGIGSQHTVGGRHLLAVQGARDDRRQFTANELKGAVLTRHFNFVGRRPHGLRRECRVFQIQDNRNDTPVDLFFQNTGIGIPAPERIHAIKPVVGASIPERAELENGIDHGRRITRLDFARQLPVHMEHRRILEIAFLVIQPEEDVEGPSVRTLR